MLAEVTVLQERLLAQEDAQLRLSNQLTLLHDQNQQLRTTVVALEAHLERKGREVQALAGLVDVDAAIAPLLVWWFGFLARKLPRLLTCRSSSY